MERRSPFGPPVPDPVDGCAACAELADRRANYRAKHDMTRVTDINVYMWRHLAVAHPDVQQDRTRGVA